MHCKQTKTGNIWDNNVKLPGTYEGTLERTCEDENSLVKEYMYIQQQKGGSKKRKRKSSTRRKSKRPSKRSRKN
jgi:hypothetical protein